MCELGEKGGGVCKSVWKYQARPAGMILYCPFGSLSEKLLVFGRFECLVCFNSRIFWPVTLCLASPVCWGPFWLPGRRRRVVGGEPGAARSKGIITEPFGRSEETRDP